MVLKNKKGLIFGVANKRSLAWAITQAVVGQGAEVALTYQSDRLKEKVETLAGSVQSCSTFLCDATNNDDVEKLVAAVTDKWGKLDFLVHAIAFAKSEELQGEYIQTSSDGFDLALKVSAYTLTSLTREFRSLLTKSESGASVVTMTYLGGERVVPGYNVMGVAKSALDMSVRYLAYDLGKDNIRVNAISAGPVNTLAARGIHGFTDILKHVQEKAPLKRNIEPSEAGNTAAFLLGDHSRGITGEIIHVDSGYHIVG